LGPNKGSPRRAFGGLDPYKAKGGPRDSAPKPGQPGYRPLGYGQPAVASKLGVNQRIGYGLATMLVLGGVAWLLFGHSKLRLTSEEAAAGLRQEMELVRTATLTIKEQTGKWPASADAVIKQLEVQGVELKALNPPLVVVVNGPATLPNSVLLNAGGGTFGVRALDAGGNPLAENGADVVLGPPKLDVGAGSQGKSAKEPDEEQPTEAQSAPARNRED
jgi:Sec-independent protein translocase protein TatA